MMKRLVTIVCFFIAISISIQKSFGQKEVADSLFKTLKTSIPDSTRAKNLVTLSEVAGWRVGKYDTALILANEAKKLSEKINFKSGIANSYNNIANVYYFQENYKEALKNYSLALAIYQEIGSKKGIANTNNNVANIQANLGNYNEALKAYFSALKIFEERGDKKLIAAMYDNICMIYEYQKNYEEAINYCNKALTLQKAVNDKSGIEYSYFNIGRIYSEQKNYTKALEYDSLALILTIELDDKVGSGNIYNNVGNIYSNTGNYDKALEAYLKAKNIYESVDYQRGLMYLYNNIGTIYTKQRKVRDASLLLQKSLTMAQESADKFQIQLSYLSLAKLDSVTGNYKSAFNNYKLYTIYKDSLINEENTKATVQTQMQYEFDKKQTADSLKAEDVRILNNLKFEQEKKQRWFLYSGLALVVLFAGFLFNRFKITQKQNIIITEQKHVVEEKHKEITDSINYAERIQRSLLASSELLDNNLNEYFVFFKPKDIVSGDFYWASNLSNKNFALIAADSTGHGVPGAIMSILNTACLNEAVKEGYTKPNEILDRTREKIISVLKRDGSVEGGKDGMDCSLLVFTPTNQQEEKNYMKLYVACANNPVWIVRASALENTSFERKDGFFEIHPDKMPVGKHDKQNEPFTLHEIDLQKGDLVYTMTDGYPDQFGGPKGKKFMTKNLRELLIKNAHLPMSDQKQLLKQTFSNWTGNLEQVDDVTVIGIKI
ncbi:MAG: tetratricopeptide repeat protein [Bacteroidetes bacterium]|nr:tetratricopeptide repeat protein [Bacteroidota bacterium]